MSAVQPTPRCTKQTHKIPLRTYLPIFWEIIYEYGVFIIDGQYLLSHGHLDLVKGWGRLGLKTIRYAVALRPGIEIRYPLLFRRNSVQNSLRILEEFSSHQQNSNLFGVFLIRILQMRAEFQMHQNSYSSDDLYICSTLSQV